MSAADLEILQLRPGSPDLDTWFDAYYDVYRTASTLGPQRELNNIYQRDEVLVALTDTDERAVREAWVGLVGGEVVATGWLEGSTVDNPELARVLVCRAPDHSGRGYAAAMLAHVEALAPARGRTRLVADITWPYAAGAAGSGSPDLAWAQRRGYEIGLVDVQRRLALPVAGTRLDRFAADAAEHHPGYTLRSFTGPVPEELAERWVELANTLAVEAPMGEIEREEERQDVAGLRAAETLIARQGRAKINTVALAPDGDLVAYTDIAVTVHESDRAYQWGTLVRPDHRGHRLGLAVKVANLRLLQQAHPQVTTLVTYNADVNAPMVRVNEQLGFVPVAWLGELQKRL